LPSGPPSENVRFDSKVRGLIHAGQPVGKIRTFFEFGQKIVQIAQMRIKKEISDLIDPPFPPELRAHAPDGF
jgi:hypothetical protein